MNIVFWKFIAFALGELRGKSAGCDFLKCKSFPVGIHNRKHGGKHKGEFTGGEEFLIFRSLSLREHKGKSAGGGILLDKH